MMLLLCLRHDSRWLRPPSTERKLIIMPVENPPVYTIYEKRNYDDTYNTIFEYLVQNHGLTLAGSDLGKDFHRNPNTGFHGYSFMTDDNDTEFETIVFGEIMPDSVGTSINAKGNHFPLKPVSDPNIVCNFKPFIILFQITDDIKIKLPITLGIPTEAPERLCNLFENQIVTLNNI